MTKRLPLKAVAAKLALALYVVAMAFLSVSNSSAQPTNYCNPTTYAPEGTYYYCYWDDSWGREYYWSYITNIQLVNNVTGQTDYERSSADDGCYFLVDNNQANVMLGTDYTLNLTYFHNYYCAYGWGEWVYNRVRVFIDWNQDGDFDDQQPGPMNEFVYGTPDDFWTYYEEACLYKTVSIPISITCSVKPGKTRMRVMVSKYDPYPYDASWNNACTNGWYYLSDWGNYNYIYGEIEDYILNFTTNITGSFPNDSPDDRSILYANEVYDGTQRLKNGTMTDFYKPEVSFSSPQPEGTYLSYKIVGPLPSTQVVYEGLDPMTGSTDIQIGGFGSSTYQIQSARGPSAYPEGASDGSFIASAGGEYRVTMTISGAGCPGEGYKLFTVAWTNDLSARDIISPKTNTAPKFFKYLRGNTIRVTGLFQNVGLNNVTRFDARARIYDPSGTMIYDRTITYDTANSGQGVVRPKQKVEIEFPSFRNNAVGNYRMYLDCDLLSAIDQEDYNDHYPRQGDQPYTFEIQHEIQLQASQLILPFQGQVMLGNRPIIPKGEFRNVGVGDASDIPAKLIVYRAWNNTVAYSSNIMVQDVPSGKYNVKTEPFDLLTLTESGDYKACLIITHPDDLIREDDTTCITFSVLGGLTGTYTVGLTNQGKANNYPTIDSAMNSLYKRGLAGPVTFELTDATYNVTNRSKGAAWEFSSYIINAGYKSPTQINSITWKPSSLRALSKGGVTINLYSGSGVGVVFGQSIEPTNKNALFNEFSNKVTLARTYANSKGYITFDGGTQKALKFVLRSGSNVGGQAFYLGEGSENITIKNVLIENGTPSIAQSSWLPMTVFSPMSGFIFQADTLEAGDVDRGYSAGVVIRSALDNSEKAQAFRLDTIPNRNNLIKGNEISGFGYGVLSLGIGELLIEKTGDYQRFFNTNNTITGNLIHDVYRAGIYLGYEENSSVTNNRIYNVGGGSAAAAGIMAGGDARRDFKGYHNIGLNISGNEISGVSSETYAAGIKVEQVTNTYPHAVKTQVVYPDVPESMKLTNNAVWGITSTTAEANRLGIHLFTERGADLQTPFNMNYLTRDDKIVNNTVIMGGDAGLLNTGMVAAVAIQQATGAKFYNNAIAFLDNEADASSPAFAAAFYQGQLPKDGGLDADRNVFWIPQSSPAAVYRFIETDASNNIIDLGSRDDYKTLSQWQIWTGEDKNSIFGDFTGDLAYTGVDPNRKLRINGTPTGSILNNRGDRIDWLASDIDGTVRGAAGQRFDIGAFEFAGIMNVTDMEVTSISSPAAYKSGAGMFNDAEYVMTKAPVEVKALIRNNGSIQASGVKATVKIYRETPAGSFTTSTVVQTTVTIAAASTETIEAAFKLADGASPDFAPQAYSDLRSQGYTVPAQFLSMQSNVTPRYKIEVSVESDQFNGNNIASKIVRFYIPRSPLSILVSAENTSTTINSKSDPDLIAGRLNYDSLMRGFRSIGWFTNLDSNRYDIDIFDRLGWEPKTVNYSMYRTMLWSDGSDKALTRFQRSDLRNFLANGSSGAKKNLVISSQEMVRANEAVDQAFVREVLSSINKAPGNPLGIDGNNDGNSVIGKSVGRGITERIVATRFNGDDYPKTGLMAPNTNSEGLALTAYYYRTHSASKTDSAAGVAGSTLSRNVLLLGIDWRHLSGTASALRQMIDFIEKNGGTVIPVELTDFNAIARDRRVDVSWTTASEFNSDRFEVERAVRSNEVTGTFTKIAEEKAAGKSTSEKLYGPVVDRNVEMNNTYVYRLRMFDKDGSYKLSQEVTAVLTSSEAAWLTSPAPNPAGTETTVNYSLPSTGEVEIALYDMAGRKVMTLASGMVDAGSHDLKINVSSLTSGTYTLMLTTGSETLTRQITVLK